MAMTAHDLKIGIPCPSFTLSSVDGKTYALSDFAQSKALLVAFICHHCPYVKAIEEELLALRSIQGLQIVGICSNDPNKYPEDAPEALLKHWQEKNYRFPYLLDTTQEVAKAFDAVCTPDLFVYDAERKLYYHGRFADLKQAVKDLLADKPALVTQIPSMGCSIKWS